MNHNILQLIKLSTATQRDRGHRWGVKGSWLHGIAFFTIVSGDPVKQRKNQSPKWQQEGGGGGVVEAAGAGAWPKKRNKGAKAQSQSRWPVITSRECYRAATLSLFDMPFLKILQQLTGFLRPTVCITNGLKLLELLQEHFKKHERKDRNIFFSKIQNLGE